MNLEFQMIDVQTGEIIARSKKTFACNFAVSNDAGFRTMMQWCQSAVRGVRKTEHKELELRIYFGEDLPLPQLPFGMSEDLVKNQALQYVR